LIVAVDVFPIASRRTLPRTAYAPIGYTLMCRSRSSVAKIETFEMGLMEGGALGLPAVSLELCAISRY
jgi:hypothetical protein